MTVLGLPQMTETHFKEFETRVFQQLGFRMNDPQRYIMRMIAGLEDPHSDTGNLMVQASPGAGKTTLIVMITMMIDMMKTIGLLREYPKILALSHMRQNRAMLENYLPGWVDKFTVHKLGWQLCQSMSTKYHIAKWKVPNITLGVLKEYYPMGVPMRDEDNSIRRKPNRDIYWELSRFINICITSLINARNLRGIEYLYEQYTPNIAGITDSFRRKFIEKIVPAILNAVDENRKEGGHMSFEEMVTVPIRAGWFNQQYDIVLVDEGQDLSPAQQIITERVARYKFVVGDRNQALMKFAGADADSWNRMTYILDATTLTMPISQRCPVKVVSYLQSLFPEVAPRDDAPAGLIRITGTLEALMQHADKSATGIVCRTHGDVAQAYVELMHADVKTPIVVLGADVYGTVKNTIQAMNRLKGMVLPFTKENFQLYLSTWEQQETYKAKKSTLQAQVDVKLADIHSAAMTVALLEQYFQPEAPDDLVTLVGQRFGTSPDDMADKQKQFKKSIVVGTAYAWKGLETSHIIIYNTKNYLEHRGKQSQEVEVLFVAMSRAKASLTFYPEKPIQPVNEVNRTVVYVAHHNNTLPYPGFDTSLFNREIEWVAGDWENLAIWETALDDIQSD